ncbi:MAG TPA: hypothetical protein VFJ43_11095, partial [Bacteroidia bacterium]|nr:hypothetical protein [Bacteroidia bacterium]
MKTFVLWCLSGILIFSANSLSANPFIHRDGKLLEDSTGKTIKLKGVNLGGWLLWEGWIWGGGFTKQGKILEQMEILTGKSNTDEFRDNVYRNFISEEDIRQVSQMGLNVVRVPFNNRIFDTLSSNAIGWQILDSLLGWCKKYHVYAVLDM